jgi:uncharacterized phage-associated protein
MPFSAAAVANEFLHLAHRDGKRISPLKMQKLVYFAHGWYLAITGRPLLAEPIQAWKYGPVIPSLYREFKEFGDSPIQFPALAFRQGKGMTTARLDDEGDPQEVELPRRVIQRVWQQYGKFSASQLSSFTHNEGSPWDTTPDKDELGTVIPDEKIRDYFIRQARAS